MPGSITSFGELQHQFFTHYNAGAFQAALDLLRSDELDLPHHAPVIAFWEVAMLARLGRVTEALQRLDAALDAGHWMHEDGVRDDPDYATLLDQPDIAARLDRLRAARLAAASEIEPLLSIFEPAGSQQSLPLLVALHGNLGNSAEFAPPWQSAAEDGWLVAVPQSVQPTWVSDFYVWDDIARARHQIAHHVATLRELYDLDEERVVVAGFSMGGEIAMRAALDQTLPARGVIGVEGWLFDLDEAPALIDVSRNPDLRFYFVAGANTQFHEDAVALRDLLVDRGYACELELTDVPHHALPADFDAVLRRALAFVMSE